MSVITTWSGRRWKTGGDKIIQVSEDFLPAMEIVDGFASKRNVTVYVTQSLRTPGMMVAGAVVTPAVMSNHLVGHAIDFNVIAADGTWCNSARLGRFLKLPEDVRNFLQDIRNHPDVRWGGDFRTPDVVHFDDMLNKRDPDLWHAKFKALWG